MSEPPHIVSYNDGSPPDRSAVRMRGAADQFSPTWEAMDDAVKNFAESMASVPRPSMSGSCLMGSMLLPKIR